MTLYPEIARADIRKGDTIRSTWTDGALTVAVEGVAHVKDKQGDWLVDSDFIQNITNIYRIGETHFLIDRPQLKLPTEKGSVIRVTKFYEEFDYDKENPCETFSLAVLDADGEWAMTRLDSSAGTDYLDESNIIEWNPVKITDLPHEL